MIKEPYIESRLTRDGWAAAFATAHSVPVSLFSTYHMSQHFCLNARSLHECLAAGHIKCVSAGPRGLDWIGSTVQTTLVTIWREAITRSICRW